MKQFKRTPLRTILDSLYTAFLPILPAILLYGIQKMAIGNVTMWIVIVTYIICLGLTFLLTFYRNSSRFEVEPREVRHYHFGKLVTTYPLDEYTFFAESKITSAGTASLKVCAQKNGKTKRTAINALGLGDKQVASMIEIIHEFQAQLEPQHVEDTNIVEEKPTTSIDDIIQTSDIIDVEVEEVKEAATQENE